MVVPSMPSLLAVIVATEAVDTSCPVALPLNTALSMVATEVLEEDQATEVVISRLLPSE